MLRRSRTGTPMSVASSDEAYIEERSKTFIIKQVPGVDGASGYISPTDTSDMDKMVDLVNRTLNSKEKQIKKEMREEFEQRFILDKQQQEETIRALKKDLSALSKLSGEDDQFKEIQKSLRKELKQQRELVQALSQENKTLKLNELKLDQLTHANKSLKEENEKLKGDNVKLQFQVGKMESMISGKDKEIESMRLLIESQYKRLKLDLTNTRDKFHTDQDVLHKDMKKQQVMLAEISQVIKSISPRTSDCTTIKTVPYVKTRKDLSHRSTTDVVNSKSLTVDRTKTQPVPTQTVVKSKSLSIQKGKLADKNSDMETVRETPAKVKKFSSDPKTISTPAEKRNQKLVAEIKVEKVQSKTRTGLVRH